MNTEFKGTKGPWSYELLRWHPTQPTQGYHVYVADHSICGMNSSTNGQIHGEEWIKEMKLKENKIPHLTIEEAEANAALIAASPDLLEALQELVSFGEGLIYSMKFEYGVPTHQSKAVDVAIKKAKNAINKAINI